LLQTYLQVPVINYDDVRRQFASDGFFVINEIFTGDEVEMLLQTISNADASNDTFRQNGDLFAIMQFVKAIPQIQFQIINQRLGHLIARLFGNDYFIIKSIYFDKPEKSNWFVPYHQDLTISVDKKNDYPGFGPWTVKQGQFAVQPPLEILVDNFTIRIHLDDTDQTNGALPVVARSHAKGVYRSEDIDWSAEREVICDVQRGGIMLMKPLLLHASSRTTSNRRRRVIHIEFGRKLLPEGLNWSEFAKIPPSKINLKENGISR
jgi:ectoine hydroxylase-related dioxygenase (phytanoyl-CoA dioxygenase family)